MPFLISLLIHGLVMTGVLLSSSPELEGVGGPKDGGQPKAREIVAKSSEVTPIVITLNEVSPTGIKQKETPKTECVNYYGGIGITHNGAHQIESVVAGYPAAKSGCIEVGDYIYGVISDNGDILGEVNKTITVQLIRSGIRISCTLKRDKICVKDIR